MRVINLFGGPGVGKSTVAAGIFRTMKIAGLNVELVTEYAREMVYELRENILKDQLYVLAKQNRRLQRLEAAGIEWAITDSPLLFCQIYSQPDYYAGFQDLVWTVWNSYDNVNVFLRRGDKQSFSTSGRRQSSLEEAASYDGKIWSLLTGNNVLFDSFFVDTDDLDQVISEFLVPDLKKSAAVFNSLPLSGIQDPSIQVHP